MVTVAVVATFRTFPQGGARSAPKPPRSSTKETSDVRPPLKSLTGGAAALALVVAGTVVSGAARPPSRPPRRGRQRGVRRRRQLRRRRSTTTSSSWPTRSSAPCRPRRLVAWSTRRPPGRRWAATPLAGMTIPAGGYFLVAEAAGRRHGRTGRTGDVVGTIAMSGTAGRSRSSATQAPGVRLVTCAADPAVVDLVGCGAATGVRGHAARRPATSNTTSVARNATHDRHGQQRRRLRRRRPDAAELGHDAAAARAAPSTRRSRRSRAPAPASPLVGQTVRTDGVVTAAYPTGGLNGYVIQTPGTGGAVDASHRPPTRSSCSRPATVGSVAVGDHVQVTGSVSEFNGLTELDGRRGRPERARPARRRSRRCRAPGRRRTPRARRSSRCSSSRPAPLTVTEHVLDEPVRRGRAGGRHDARSCRRPRSPARGRRRPRPSRRTTPRAASPSTTARRRTSCRPPTPASPRRTSR